MKYSKFLYPDLCNLNKDKITKSDINSKIENLVLEHLKNITGIYETNHLTLLKLINTNNDYKLQIKQNYEQGYNDAKIELEKVLNEHKEANEFTKHLQDKITKLEENTEILKKDLIKISIQLVNQLVKKLYLKLQIDLKEILTEQISLILDKVYKDDKIIIYIHNDKLNDCQNIITSLNISEEMKNQIQVLTDNNLEKNDCKIQWKNTEISYTTQDITSTIEKIINQAGL